MIRKLSLAVAVATALSPVGIFALGLGDIHTQSALNQRFKAEIDLLSVSRDELEDVRAELASSEAFLKAGIERPFLLSALRFTPSLTADGRMVIAVNSEDPIREPFLNFLLEVNWPKGRILREYTVLLDPPVTLDRRPAAIQAPRVAAAPERQLAPASRTSSAVVAGSYPAAVAATGGVRDYGPVQANDNLWNIAKSMRLQGESVEQVMMALQRYNPDAFLYDNVNDLKAGKILRLPEGADVTSMSQRDARREFLAQTREWRERRSKPAVETGARQLAQEQTESVKTAADTEPTDTTKVIEEKDRLELVSAKPDASEQGQVGEGRTEDAEKISRLEQEVMLVREENASSRQENEALQTRVRELEAQLSDIQRLLSLRSDELTQMQTMQKTVEEKTEALAESAKDEPQVVAAPQPTLPVQPGVEAEVSEQSVEAVDEIIEEVDIESIVVAAMKQAEPAQETVASDTQPAEPAEAEVTVEQAVVEPPPVTPVSPPVADSKQPTPAQPVAAEKPKQGGFLDTLSGNSTLMGIVGAVVVLLGLLWMIMRRRKEAEAEFAESILVTPEGETEVDSVQGSAGAINEPSEETSFMSDFSPSDIDALQDETGEVDPVSEADVYIAYGRYQQAEELIKQAIERFPEREELKHKLLEIYYSAKNSTQFNRLAEELQKAGLEKDKPDVWARIAGMGKELDPGNPLFSGAAGVAAGVGLAALGSELDDLDLNLNSDLLEDDRESSTDTPERQASETEDALNDLDLSDLSNLDEMESGALESSLSLDSEFLKGLGDEEDSVAEEANQASDALDVDLSGLEDASGFAEQVEEEDDLDLSSTLDGLSEISGLDLSESDENEVKASDNSNVIDLEDVEADDENVIGLEDSEALDDLDLESLEKELEMLSGDLDDKPIEESVAQELDLPEEIAQQPEEVAESADVIDLDSTDEVTTKLDLARAYVDMGDAEGAKSILEEVVTEGSDEQKQLAQELLGSMAS